jgi:Family of unknown function (DUF5681)
MQEAEMDREFPRTENERASNPSSEAAEAAATAGAAQQTDEYHVGPGRPPKEYRWKKGQSGNPTGIKRSAKSARLDLKQMLNEALNEPVTLRSGKREAITTKAAAGIAQLVTQFAEGDRHARRDLIALATKLGIDLTAGQTGAIGEAVATLMSASDEAIINDFLRRHGVEPEPAETSTEANANQSDREA